MQSEKGKMARVSKQCRWYKTTSTCKHKLGEKALQLDIITFELATSRLVALCDILILPQLCRWVSCYRWYTQNLLKKQMQVFNDDFFVFTLECVTRS